MELQLNRCLRVILTLLLTIGYLPGTNAKNQHIGGENIPRQFSNFCERLQQADLTQRVDSLCVFIEQNPNYLKAYERLRNELLWHGEIVRAREIFSNFAKRRETSARAFWLLAQLSRLQNADQQAVEYFRRALAGASEEPVIISDYIDFCGYYEKSDSLRMLEFLRQHSGKSKIFKIISAYKNKSPGKISGQLEQFSGVEKYEKFYFNYRCLLQWQKRDWPAAENTLKNALKRAIDRGDKFWQLQSYNMLVSLNTILNKFDSALAIADTARKIANSLRDPYLIAVTELTRANAISSTKDFKTSIKIYEKTLPNLEWCPDFHLLINAYWKLSYAYSYDGKYISALKATTRAERLAIKNKNQPWVTFLQFQKAQYFHKLNQSELSERIFNHILEQTQAENPRMFLSALRELGTIALHKKQYSAAREYFFKALPGTANNRYYVLARIARTYYLQGDYELARKYYEDVLAATPADDIMVLWNIMHLGEVALAQDKLKLAENYLQKALAGALEEGETELLWEVYYACGRLYLKKNQIQRAIHAFQHALSFIEIARNKLTNEQFRIGYFIEPFAVYSSLAETYFQRFIESRHRADLDSLFYYSSFTRGRTLEEFAAAAHGQEKFLNESQAAAPYRRLRQKVTSMQRNLRLISAVNQTIPDSTLELLQTTRLDMLMQKYEALEEWESTNKTGNALLQQMGDLDLLQSTLKGHDQAILHYHISDGQSFVVAITAEQVTAVPLEITALELAAAMETLLRPFYNITPENSDRLPFHAETAFSLYLKLFQPVQATLSLPPKIIVIPDAHIASLPFDLLLDSKPGRDVFYLNDEPGYRDKLLLYKYVISYCPANSVILKKYPKMTATHDLLALINPNNQAPSNDSDEQNLLRYQVPNSFVFGPLINAEKEGNALASLNLDSKILRKKQATEQAFRQQYADYRVLHFATHAFVDTVLAPFSGLVLALVSDTTQDGLLMGYEISEFDLNCDLVTLGACETGRGRSVVGEGVLGLPRMLLSAGARSVVQTLWKIDDEYSGSMTPVFYDNYFFKKMDKATALCMAKRQQIQESPKYAHPFFWAAFTLYGKPGVGEVNWFAKNKMLLIFVCGLIFISIVVYLRSRSRQRISILK